MRTMTVSVVSVLLLTLAVPAFAAGPVVSPVGLTMGPSVIPIGSAGSLGFAVWLAAVLWDLFDGAGPYIVPVGDNIGPVATPVGDNMGPVGVPVG